LGKTKPYKRQAISDRKTLNITLQNKENENRNAYIVELLFYIMTKNRKPCRYKACKGVVHRGKCPVASKRGSKGGSTKGQSKVRSGSNNGRFTGLRECGCPKRQHLPSCIHSQLTLQKVKIINAHDFNYNSNLPLENYQQIIQSKFPKSQTKVRIARKENIPLKRTVAKWELENAVKVKSIPHYSFLKYTGVCVSCGCERDVPKAHIIHVDDIKYKLSGEHYFKARIVCDACEA
jgi:hypothetical protein|tara:strand:+ start:119 stop:820 length:702 start_codon:yes stop_codon:yes gene_type:complete